MVSKQTESKYATELDLRVYAQQRVREHKRQRRLRWANRALTPICIILALFVWWRLTR